MDSNEQSINDINRQTIPDPQVDTFGEQSRQELQSMLTKTYNIDSYDRIEFL